MDDAGIAETPRPVHLAPPRGRRRSVLEGQGGGRQGDRVGVRAVGELHTQEARCGYCGQREPSRDDTECT